LSENCIVKENNKRMNNHQPQEDILAQWEKALAESKGQPEAGDPSLPEDLKALARATAGWKVPATRSEEESWALLVARIREREAQQASREGRLIPLMQKRWLPLSAAASIALLIAVGLLWMRQQPEAYRTASQEQRSISLPDGSRAELNGASSLQFVEARWKEGERSLRLDGEAYFEVRSGSRFSVQTPQGEVSVRGTRFNVRQRKDALHVTCYEGQVEVAAKGGETLLLSAGQDVKFREGSLVSPVKKVQIAEPEWTVGQFHFEDEPFEAVVEEFQRVFDVKITYPASMKGRMYTGGFSAQDRTLALRMICEPYGLRYSESGSNIELKSP
jgi:ferric-dicitrate binding protein FerR (iron transport regulator)